MMTLTIDIPALDRLCAWLESRDKAGLLEAIENEITSKLKDAAEGGVPRPKFEETPPADSARGETAPETRKAPVNKESRALPAHEMEPPKPEVTEKPTAPAAKEESRALPAHEIAPATPAATLDAVQRAAAQMRDDGKLKAVTDMFPEFGIKKLSDLKGDQLQAFAKRLRAMGAKI